VFSFPKREDVERENNSRLMQLQGEARTYPSRDIRGLDSKGTKVSDKQMESLLERLVTPKRISLKVSVDRNLDIAMV
jgi:hypothetical protein